MSHPIIRLQSAHDDLVEIYDTISEADPSAADHFLDAVARTPEDTISHNPEIGSKRTYDSPRLSELRMFRVKGFPKYLIFYEFRENKIIVVRVLHGARDIDFLFRNE